MAVTTNYGSLVMANIHEDNAAIPVMPPVTRAGGRVRHWVDTVETAADDSVGSLYYFARLPSDCIILPQSTVYFDDVGTNASTLDIGDSNDPDGLATDIDIATAAGNSTILEAITIDEYGQYLWQMLGYTSDPNTQIDLYATLAGGATTAASTLTFLVLYVHD